MRGSADPRVPSLKVYGYACSGMGYVARLVQSTFWPDAVPAAEPTDRTIHWSKPLNGRATLLPHHGLLGDSRAPVVLRPRRSIYVYRDGRDVALDLWACAGIVPSGQTACFGDWLRTAHNWRGAPGLEAMPTASRFLWHDWREHLAAGSRTGAMLLRCEDAVRMPQATVAQVERWFELERRADPEAGPRSAPRIKAWEDRMSSADQSLFNAVISPRFFGRFGK